MNKDERHNRILQLINSSDGTRILGTREFAKQLSVSDMTVRRDLQELEQAGLLLRQHGSAILARQPISTQPSLREIGVILVSSMGKYNNPFFNAVLEGADQKLQELGYRIAYINLGAKISTAQQAQELLASIPISGIILVGTRLGVESVDYLKAHLRSLVATIEPIGPEYDTIVFDGYAGMQSMVTHLVQCGYRRLGFITGRYDTRQQGFLDAIKVYGLPSDPDLCLVVPEGIDGWTPELGKIGTHKLMQLAEPPEAIMCASDLIAIGAIQWLQQNNYRVPEDVAVTGFDNITESTFTTPALTTIHVHKQLIGELAAERIVKRIENEDEVPLLIQTPTHLVIRQSSGKSDKV
jgi:DNA-binding LacI/PurR family transcriptional regulator